MKKLLTVLLTVMLAFTTIGINVLAETDDEEVVEVVEQEEAVEELAEVKAEEQLFEEVVEEEKEPDQPLQADVSSFTVNGVTMTAGSAAPEKKDITFSNNVKFSGWPSDFSLTGTTKDGKLVGGTKYTLTLVVKTKNNDEEFKKTTTVTVSGASSVVFERNSSFKSYGTVTITFTPETPKQDAEVKEEPTLVEGFTFDNKDHKLLDKAGKAEGGKINYGFGVSDKEAPKTWIEKADDVKKKDAGTYYVWYKVVGDPTHKDIDAKYIGSVTIGQKEVTFTAPTAKELIFNKKDHAEKVLINAGSLLLGEGVVKYYLGERAPLSDDAYKNADQIKGKVDVETTYTVWYKVFPNKNYKYSGTNPDKITVTITDPYKKTVLKPTLEDNEVTYNAQVQNPEVLGMEKAVIEIPGIIPFKPVEVPCYDVTYSKYNEDTKAYDVVTECVDAGTYKVTLKITDAEFDKFAFEDDKQTKELVYTIKKAVVTASLEEDKVEWNGEVQNPTVLIKLADGTVLDDSCTAWYIVNHSPKENCIEVADYSVVVWLTNDNVRFRDERQPILVYKITKVAIDAGEKVSLVYNGKLQQPFDSDAVIFADEDIFGNSYTNKATNVGKYEALITIKDTAHYEFKGYGYPYRVVEWEITEAELPQVQISPLFPKANKGSDAECVIANLDAYEDGTKFEAYVDGAWKAIDVDEDGNLVLPVGLNKVRAVADNNHKHQADDADVCDVFVRESTVEYTVDTVKEYKGTKSIELVCDRPDYFNLLYVTLTKNGKTNTYYAGVDYTLEEGSTKVTLNSVISAGLARGTYEVGFHYADGMHVEGDLIIKTRPSNTFVAPKTGVR